MKTPREWVEPIYDGADYQPWRIMGMTCGALEGLVHAIQKDAFDAGRVAGLREALDRDVKTLCNPPDTQPKDTPCSKKGESV